MAHFSVGDIFGETFAIAERAWAAVLLYVVVSTGLNVFLELAFGETLGLWSSSLAGLVLGYALMGHVMKREGLPFAGMSVFLLVVYLVATLVSSIAIFIGTLLLVVPGLLLLARWSLVPTMIIGRGMGMLQAFSESWGATRSKQWTLVGFYVLLILAFVLLLALVGGGFAGVQIAAGDGEDVLATGSPAGVLVEAVGSFVGSLFACSNVALYVLLVERGHEEEAIFA